MTTQWQPLSTAASWPQQLYYSPVYWQYMPAVYPMYRQPTYSDISQTRPSPRPELLLHRFLGGHRRPTAVWDVSENINRALRLTARGQMKPVTPQFLASPATNPPTTRMRIVCDWPIDIILPPGAEDRFISIKVVLEAIHGTLLEPLEPEEWREMCPGDRRRTYKAMCDRLAKSRALMRASGEACRIDIFSHKTMFLGLRPGGASADEWVLTLGPRRGPS